MNERSRGWTRSPQLRVSAFSGTMATPLDGASSTAPAASRGKAGLFAVRVMGFCEADAGSEGLLDLEMHYFRCW